jgi:hypothetical protein
MTATTPTAPTPRSASAPKSTSAQPSASPTPSSSSGAPLDLPPIRPANGSWVLRADRLVLRGSRFRGVVTLRTAAGAVRVLKFTARSLDAVDLDVTAGRGRAALRLRSRPASTSTIEGRGGDGTVTLYVSKLSGTLVGLDGSPLPADRAVTLTPDAVPLWLSQPPSRTRTLTFVDATMSPVAQFGGQLSLTGLALRTAAG